MSFKIASSPHNRLKRKTPELMRLVIFACIPGIIVQWYFFGAGNLIHIGIAASICLLCEALILAMREKPIRKTLLDNSAIVTAVLIGISLPPFAPWWVTVIGAAFAIIVTKQLYGGLGSNPFNPAMSAYVLLLVSFPLQMTMWSPPAPLQSFDLSLSDSFAVIFSGFSNEGYSVAQLRMNLDGVTMATPLDTLRTDLTQGLTATESLANPVFSQHAGIGWEMVNLAFLIGGLILWQLKVIKWQIPLATLGGLGFMAIVGMVISPDQTASPIFHWFSGATMFAAFFIATDPVSASTTNKGRLIFGFTIGALVYIIRTWGGYPDAFAFSILLANMAVPLIDQLTQPKVYGQKPPQPAAKKEQS